MDRKAFGTCAAVVVSLGAILSAGCGDNSAPSPASARKDSPRVAEKPRAVMVSRAEGVPRPQFGGLSNGVTSDRGSLDDERSHHVGARAALGEDDALDTATPGTEVLTDDDGPASLDARYEAWPAGNSDLQATDGSAFEGQHDAAFDSGTDKGSSTGSEIKFALSEPSPLTDDDGTALRAATTDEQRPAMFRLEVQSDGSTTAAAPLAKDAEAMPGSSGPKQSTADAARIGRQLTPVVVTPRDMPHDELVRQEQETGGAIDTDTIEVAQPELAEAKVKADAEGAPTPERFLVPPPKAIVAAQPVVEAAPMPVSKAPHPTTTGPVAEPQRTTPVQPQSKLAVQPRPESLESIAQAPPAAPRPSQPVAHSPAMIAALARADQRVRHAIQLAEKGAFFAARKEFTSAIQMVAQARDVEHGTRQYTKATAAGFLALKEANDFLRAGEVDVRRTVVAHSTPVLKQINTSDMPSSIAAQHYFQFAQQQFAAGVGRGSVGSIALYGLAKIIVAGAGHNSQQLEYTGPAMALYQAALVAEPHNFRAAHELGVLLAGAGQLDMARQMLLGSAAASPEPMIWKNLAVVHSRLGEPQMAEQASQKAATLQATRPDSNAPPVQWVDPATFANTSPANDALVPAGRSPNVEPPAAQASAEPKPKANVAKKRITEWNPLNLRR